jgi:nucleotide-binding universal stress UspA family protein
MKILIGYDGSRSADAALDDLQKAGLPDDVEAQVISIAEVWMPPPNGNKSEKYLTGANPEWLKIHDEVGKKAVVEAEVLSRHAKERLEIKFPEWKVCCEATYGSPAQEILAEAEISKPDLIVVGSQGKSAINRILLGSISSKVLTQARVSVRVARGRIEVDPVPVRIIIGFDGSPGSLAAVQAVVSRKWRDDSEARLVSATNSTLPSAIGRFIPPVGKMFEDEKKSERVWIEKLAETAIRKLNDSGLKTELCVEVGNPKQVLIEEAEKWGADCIFVGSHSFGSKLERLVVGSTSAAIAERAHCSVEVVRYNEHFPES